MQCNINYKKALGFLEGYFDNLAVTGYVGEGTLNRFMIYLFLTDFVETLYDYMTESDATKVMELLHCLFKSDDCLLAFDISTSGPSTVSIGNRLEHIQRMAPFAHRHSCLAVQLRIAEEGDLRRTEVINNLRAIE